MLGLFIYSHYICCQGRGRLRTIAARFPHLPPTKSAVRIAAILRTRPDKGSSRLFRVPDQRGSEKDLRVRGFAVPRRQCDEEIQIDQ